MQVMTQGWVMATLTSSAFMLGLVNLCAGLPMLALTMVGGSAADKFDKRKILLITQYVQIVLAISIGLLIWSGKIQIWHIFVFAALLGVSNSFEMPTLSALVPELVKRDEIQSAISIDRSVFHGSRVVGPAIGGYLISAWGMASAFFANAISFVALIVAIRRRGETRHWDQGGVSLRRQGQAKPRDGYADRDSSGLYLPHHYCDDAPLRKTCPQIRRGQARHPDGRFRGGLRRWFAFPDRLAPRETRSINDDVRDGGHVCGAWFVARAGFLFCHRPADRQFTWLGYEFRSR